MSRAGNYVICYPKEIYHIYGPRDNAHDGADGGFTDCNVRIHGADYEGCARAECPPTYVLLALHING